MVKKATEKEQYTTVFPRVRAKPSQLVQLHTLAAKAGMSKKLGEFIRRRVLGEKIAEKPDGMPRLDVLANQSDLATLRSRLADQPDILLIVNRISQRHLNALRDDLQIQHPR